MHEEPLDAMLAALRNRAAAEMKDALRNAPMPVLRKVATDIVPALVRIASYAGEPIDAGENWVEVVARSRVAGLPPILVRMHRGPFDAADGKSVIASLRKAESTQVAVIFLNDRAVNVAPFIGADAQWTFDLDGLVNLMLNAGVGVTERKVAALFIDGGYFGR